MFKIIYTADLHGNKGLYERLVDFANKDKFPNETLQKLINNFTLQAPALIVIVVEKPTLLTQFAGWVKKRDFEWTDLGIAAEHICLQATELELGTCMVGWFDEKKIIELLNIPKNKRVGLVISIGYPADNYTLRKKTRKPLEQILTYNKY